MLLDSILSVPPSFLALTPLHLPPAGASLSLSRRQSRLTANPSGASTASAQRFSPASKGACVELGNGNRTPGSWALRKVQRVIINNSNNISVNGVDTIIRASECNDYRIVGVFTGRSYMILTLFPPCFEQQDAFKIEACASLYTVFIYCTNSEFDTFLSQRAATRATSCRPLIYSEHI